MMRVRAYLRRSHERVGGISLEVQRDAAQAKAATEFHTTLEATEYVDDDKSAFRDDLDNRPAMRQALEDAKRRAFDVLIVYKWDRLARSEAVFHGLLADFKRAKVRVVSATESSDPLNRSLSGLLAAEYSRILSRRMSDVRRWEASQGKLIGPPPRGYDRGSDGIPVQNGDAPMVRELGERYATGEWSPYRLAQHYGLNVYAVREMLECAVYAGFIVCAGEVFTGKHEPIWPAALWERIQAVRERRAVRRSAPARTHDPLLAGLICCAHCGAPLWHTFTNGRRYYECSTRRTARPGPVEGLVCDHRRVAAEPVEGAVLALLGSLASMGSVLDDVRHAIRQTPLPRPSASRPSLEALKARFLREEISAADYERLRAELMQAPAMSAPSEPLPIGAAIDLLNDLPALLRAAIPTEVRPVLREIITEVYARRQEVIGVRPTHIGAVLFDSADGRSEEWLNESAAWWAGWAPDPRDDTLFTFLLPQRLAA
jgi:DNA invertase Pin-like site-specific DNA recombinase